MPLAQFNQAVEYGAHPQWGSSRVATGSSFFVLCTDTATGQVDDPANPWAVIDETEPNHAVYRPVGVPRAYNWLDVMMCIDDGTLGTPPSVAAFGKLPHRPSSAARSWPQDDSGSFDDLSDPAVGVWIGLPSIDEVGALTHGPVALNGGTMVSRSGLVLSFPTTFQLKGVATVLVLVTTQQAGGTENYLVGQFHG